jgi:ketopantoate reductase
VVGGRLTKAGHDVTLVDQWPDHVEAMKKVGLRLSGTCGADLIPVRAFLIHELQSVAEPFDAVFISVKFFDTEWAVALGLSYLKKPVSWATILPHRQVCSWLHLKSKIPKGSTGQQKDETIDARSRE